MLDEHEQLELFVHWAAPALHINNYLILRFSQKQKQLQIKFNFNVILIK